MRTLAALLISIAGTSALAQGDLIHLKEQRYMDLYRSHPFDCDHLSDEQVNTFTDRICANLRLQRSDSLLKVYYDSLVVEIRHVEGDSLLRAFEELQRAWRDFRDRHCEAYVGEIVGNSSAAMYMDEMRMLTEIRIEELKRLLALYRPE